MKSQQYIKISLNIVCNRFLLFFVFTFLFSSVLLAQNSKFTIVLDAGHGGKDPGTVGLQTYKNSYERDIVLKVVKKLAVLLKKEKSIKTIYTRDTNKFVELHKRGKIANTANADLFISIHCNAAVTNAYGTTTYVLGMGKTAKNLELSKRENDVILLEDDREKNYKHNSDSQEFLIGITMMQEDYLERSIEFASIVQNKFKTVAKRKDRGVNQGNLAVLYYTYMPSVLIEIGFLTNKKEEKYLNTNYGQTKISESIYEAIKTYKSRLEKNSVEVVPQTTSKKKYYRIQIATSTKKIETKAYNFKGLNAIERIKVGNIYKYFYGISTNIKAAKKLRLKAIKAGYKDAFVKRFDFSKKKDDIFRLNYVDTAKKKSKKKKNVRKNVYPGVDFKVQISSSVTKIEVKAYNFKGLKNIERVKIGSHYKYYYGKTSNYSDIIAMRKIAVKKGYKQAFIAAVKNGKRIPVRDVIKKK